MNCEFLDGRKFVAWLEDEIGGAVSEKQSPALGRRIREWRSGRMVSIWKADTVLIELGLHLGMVPDELWLSPAQAHERYIRRREHKDSNLPEREAVVSRCRQGATQRAVAEEFGISERTVREWIQRSK